MTSISCPVCKGEFKDIGDMNYYSVHVYECTRCGLRKLRCGDTGCDGYMEGELLPWGDYRYKCTKCEWIGTSAKAPPRRR